MRTRENGTILSAIFLLIGSLVLCASIQHVYAFNQNTKNEFYPGDALNINFINIFKNTERGAVQISGDYKIDSKGSIMLPLIGPFKVIGYNRFTLADKIREIYQPYFTEPYISITPLIRVVIMGPFYKPGSYWINAENSLWSLIDMAGGPTGNIDFNSIKVIRNDKVVIENLLASFEKGHSLDDIGVKSGDQIIAASQKRFGVREFFEYLKFGMSLLSLYILIMRWENLKK